MKTTRLFTTLLFIAAFAVIASAKTIYCSYNGNNTNDGLSWSKAVLSIDTAKVRAAAGDQIWIQGDAEGLTGYNLYARTSAEAGQGKEALSFGDVDVYGGFKGDETSLLQRQLLDVDGNRIIEPWEFKYPTRIVFELSNGARAFVFGGQTSTRVVDGIEFWMPTNYDFSNIAAEVQMFVIGNNSLFRNNTIRDGFVKSNNTSLRPYVWNKGRMEYCLFQNNTVTGTFSGTTDIQFSPLIEIFYQQKTTDITPGIVNCVIRNNKSVADFSNSTLTSLAGRQRGLLIYINLHDAAKGSPSIIANNLIYNNECSYIKSASSPATTNGGLLGTGFNNGTGISSVSLINNTIANNKVSNLAANFMLVNEGAAYYSNIINNVFWKNEKYLSGVLVSAATTDILSRTPVLGNVFNNYSTGKSIWNNPAAPKRINGNAIIETSETDKALFVLPTTVAGVISDDSYQKANWSLKSGSVLVGKGVASNQNDTVAAVVAANLKDFSGRSFATFRAVGAFEEGLVNTIIISGLKNTAAVVPTNFLLPVSGGVKLIENGNIQVISLMGQVVFSTEAEAGQIINLSKGIYLVRLQSTKGNRVQKVVIQH